MNLYTVLANGVTRVIQRVLTRVLLRERAECFVLLALYLITLYLVNLISWFTALPALPALLLVLLGEGLFKRIEVRYRRFVLEKLLVSGRGLNSFKIKTVVRAFRLLLTSTLLVAGFTLLVVRSHPVLATSLVVALSSLTALTYIYPYIAVYAWISQRRTDAEVEIPYLLAVLRALSSLRIPLHEMLEVVENSACLRAFSREVKFAKKLTMVFTTSTVTALDVVAAQHPSSIVKDYLRRVFSAASELGDIKEVVDRVFESVSQWFELRITRLFERSTIIVGSVMLVYFFIPVIVATVLPVFFGGASLLALVVVISVEFAAFFSLYALLSATYPSSFIIKPPRSLVLVGIASLVSSTTVTTINALFSIAGYELPWVEHTLWFLILAVLPPAIIAERHLSKRGFYDKFIYVASDALSLSASTGENPIKALEGTAKKHGKKMLAFTRTISVCYASKIARYGLVSRAPSLYHASFLEILMVILLYGWTPEALKALSSYYERLHGFAERLKSFALTLELIVISLAGLVGGFIEFIKNVYRNIEALIKLTPTTGLRVELVIHLHPGLFNALDSAVLLSIVLVSAFVGKTRGGSVFYMYRTALAMLLTYVASKMLVAFIIT